MTIERPAQRVKVGAGIRATGFEGNAVADDSSTQQDAPACLSGRHDRKRGAKRYGGVGCQVMMGTYCTQ